MGQYGNGEFVEPPTQAVILNWVAYYKNFKKRGKISHLFLQQTAMPTTEFELMDKIDNAIADCLFKYALKDYELKVYVEKVNRRYKSTPIFRFAIKEARYDRMIFADKANPLIADIYREMKHGNMDEVEDRFRLSYPRPEFTATPSDMGFNLWQYGGSKPEKESEIEGLFPANPLTTQGYGTALGKIEGHAAHEGGTSSKHVEREVPLY